MFEPLLENLGLAKNEAKIYEALLQEGESSVGHIATKSKVHRRNVYDTLKRLIEKGLVFEIVQSKENHYQAVDPVKLSELLQEKQTALSRTLSEMQRVFNEAPGQEAVYIYRGLEGWKNYMRDILRVNQAVYIIGGKGAWTDPKIQPFVEQFSAQAKKQGIVFYLLFDAEAKPRVPALEKQLGNNYKFFPKEFSTASAIDIFGDHIVIMSDAKGGIINDELSTTVIINQAIADSFRIWFQALWSISKDEK